MGDTMLKICRRYSELNIPALLAVYEESLGKTGGSRFLAEQDFCDYLREDFFRVSGAYCALWLHEGCYVCALRVEPYRDGFLISVLETAPQDRRRGYGAALVTAVCQISFPVYVHVQKANVASLSLHRRCGFQEHLDYGILLDGTVSRQYVTLRYSQ